MTRHARRLPTDALDLFLAEIRAVPLLTAEEEARLARAWRDDGDARAAHELITANLRFVVKVAHEYRTYGFRARDLIQEGNIGLMKAVQKFDPEKQIRLISYAVWWIRAYIQNYILRSWSLVKIGTTQAQRKLFFSLARTKRELERLGGGTGSDLVADRLHVRESEVIEMERRLDGRDLSLDAPWGEDGAHHPRRPRRVGRESRRTTSWAPGRSGGSRPAGCRVAIARLDDRRAFIIQQPDPHRRADDAQGRRRPLRLLARARPAARAARQGEAPPGAAAARRRHRVAGERARAAEAE